MNERNLVVYKDLEGDELNREEMHSVQLDRLEQKIFDIHKQVEEIKAMLLALKGQPKG